MNGQWVATERLEQALRADDRRCAGDARMDGFDWSGHGGRTGGTLVSSGQRVVEIALAQLESEGQILRGNFSAPEQFCHRRILARIHRLTLGRLRKEIEPVSTAEFMRFLCRWQHVAPGTQQHGADGLFQVLKQLEGYEISAAGVGILGAAPSAWLSMSRSCWIACAFRAK